jgi:hypothetical protein
VLDRRLRHARDPALGGGAQRSRHHRLRRRHRAAALLAQRGGGDSDTRHRQPPHLGMHRRHRTATGRRAGRRAIAPLPRDSSLAVRNQPAHARDARAPVYPPGQQLRDAPVRRRSARAPPVHGERSPAQVRVAQRRAPRCQLVQRDPLHATDARHDQGQGSDAKRHRF